MALRPSPPVGSPGANNKVGKVNDDCAFIEIHIEEIIWENNYTRITNENKLIDIPFGWSHLVTNAAKEDIANFCYDGCSKKPAVYFVEGAPTHNQPELTVKIKAKQICGDMSAIPDKEAGKSAYLEMILDGVRFMSEKFSLPGRDQEYPAILKCDKSHAIKWLKGAPIFTLYYDKRDWGEVIASALPVITTSGLAGAATSGHHFNRNHYESVDIKGKENKPITLEAFILYDMPASFYTIGVWVEALRFLFHDITTLQANSDQISSARNIINHVFEKMNIIYDTIEGDSYFVDANDPDPALKERALGGDFRLRGYLLNTYIESALLREKFYTRNCYDQAAIIQALLGAIGVKSDWIFMIPFGYIRQTNLIGVGQCNNPFYKGRGNSKIETNIVNRTSFGNHAFIELNKKIIDACAGPHLATESLLMYGKNSIEYFKYNGALYSSSAMDDGYVRMCCSQYGYPCKGIKEIKWDLERVQP